MDHERQKYRIIFVHRHSGLLAFDAFPPFHNSPVSISQHLAPCLQGTCDQASVLEHAGRFHKVLCSLSPFLSPFHKVCTCTLPTHPAPTHIPFAPGTRSYPPFFACSPPLTAGFQPTTLQAVHVAIGRTSETTPSITIQLLPPSLPLSQTPATLCAFAACAVTVLSVFHAHTAQYQPPLQLRECSA